MKILHISMFDTAGVPWMQCRALNQIPGVEARWHRTRRGLFGEYEPDFPGRERDALSWAEKCDVVHWHTTNVIKNAPQFSNLRRPAVVEIHGAPERGTGQRPRLKNPVVIVSTPDMLKWYPKAEWVPNHVFTDEDPWTPVDRTEDQVIICRGATPHPTLKDVAVMDSAARYVEARVEHAYFRDLPRMRWRQYNERKRECDVLLDHLQGYYGVVSIEAMSQGVVPVVGLAPDVRARVLDRFGELPPWLDIRDRRRLHLNLKALCADVPALRAKQQRCREFMLEKWTAPIVMEQILLVYARAASAAPG